MSKIAIIADSGCQIDINGEHEGIYIAPLCIGHGSQTYLDREFDSCLQFFTNQIAQNVDYINAFEFFYCQIRENKCTNMG